MPAKDNDPTAPRSPSKKIAKTSAKKTAAKAPIEATPKSERASTADDLPNAKPARRRRATVVDPAPAVVASETAAPKRRPSARRPKAVTAAAEVAAESVADSTGIADATERRSDASVSFEEEVRLRAYLLYAERGFLGGSAESDWFRAEHEVTRGR